MVPEPQLLWVPHFFQKIPKTSQAYVPPHRRGLAEDTEKDLLNGKADGGPAKNLMETVPWHWKWSCLTLYQTPLGFGRHLVEKANRRILIVPIQFCLHFVSGACGGRGFGAWLKLNGCQDVGPRWRMDMTQSERGGPTLMTKQSSLAQIHCQSTYLTSCSS